jgi:hypothetical protein
LFADSKISPHPTHSLQQVLIDDRTPNSLKQQETRWHWNITEDFSIASLKFTDQWSAKTVAKSGQVVNDSLIPLEFEQFVLKTGIR